MKYAFATGLAAVLVLSAPAFAQTATPAPSAPTQQDAKADAAKNMAKTQPDTSTPAPDPNAPIDDVNGQTDAPAFGGSK